MSHREKQTHRRGDRDIDRQTETENKTASEKRGVTGEKTEI